MCAFKPCSQQRSHQLGGLVSLSVQGYWNALNADLPCPGRPEHADAAHTVLVHASTCKRKNTHGAPSPQKPGCTGRAFRFHKLSPCYPQPTQAVLTRDRSGLVPNHFRRQTASGNQRGYAALLWFQIATAVPCAPTPFHVTSPRGSCMY